MKRLETPFEGCFERPGSRWGPVAGLLCPRMLNKIPWKRKTFADTADPPLARAPGAGPTRPLPRCRSLPVACMELSVARRCWVRPALSEKSAFSSCLRNGLRAYAPRGASPGRSPRVHAPERLVARSVCSLVYCGPRLPAPSSRRDHAGQELRRPPLCSELVREIRFPVAGGWGRAAHTPACAVTPVTPRVVAGRGGVWKGGGGLPVPPASPFPPCLLSRASLPLASTSRPLSRRGRVARGACRVLSCECGCRLVPPPSSAAFPRPVESREPSSPSTGFWRVRVSRGWPRSRGRTLFGGAAVGRVRRVVGRRDPLPLVGLRRWASVSASVLSRAGWRLLGFFPRGSVGLGSVGSVLAGVAGLLPGSGVQRDSRRFSPRVPGRRPSERASPGPLVRRLPPGGPCGRPCRRRPSFLPSRSPSPRAGGPSPPRLDRPTRGRAAGPSARGAAGHARAPGGRRGARGRGRPAGGRSCGLKGVPVPRPRRRLARSLEAACGGKVAPRGERKEA